VAVNPAVNLEGTVVLQERRPFHSNPSKSASEAGLCLQSGQRIQRLFSPVDASGKFSAVGVAGEEALVEVIGLPDTAYVSDIRQGDQSVFDSGLRLTASPEPLRVIVEAMGGTV
jgi:hypothetical protein